MINENKLPIEKEDVVNALKVLKTMLKHAKLNSGDVADLMIKELELVDFIHKVPVKDQIEQVVKFDKSFEALYKIAMSMADNCIGNKTMIARYHKLEEEFAELMEQLTAPMAKYGSEELRNSKSKKHYHPGGENVIMNVEEIQGELGDVLFVLLHIGHKLDITPFQLLHQASSKMLFRMADPEYKAKV